MKSLFLKSFQFKICVNNLNYTFCILFSLSLGITNSLRRKRPKQDIITFCEILRPKGTSAQHKLVWGKWSIKNFQYPWILTISSLMIQYSKTLGGVLELALGAPPPGKCAKLQYCPEGYNFYSNGYVGFPYPPLVS